MKTESPQNQKFLCYTDNLGGRPCEAQCDWCDSLLPISKNKKVLMDRPDPFNSPYPIPKKNQEIWNSPQLKAYADFLARRPDYKERSNKDLAIDFCDYMSIGGD